MDALVSDFLARLFWNQRWPIDTRSASIPFRGAMRASSCNAATCSISGSAAPSTSSVPALSASRQSRSRSRNVFASSVPARSSMLDPIDQLGIGSLQVSQVVLFAFQFLARDRLIDWEEAYSFGQLQCQRQRRFAAFRIHSGEIEQHIGKEVVAGSRHRGDLFPQIGMIAGGVDSIRPFVAGEVALGEIGGVFSAHEGIRQNLIQQLTRYATERMLRNQVEALRVDRASNQCCDLRQFRCFSSEEIKCLGSDEHLRVRDTFGTLVVLLQAFVGLLQIRAWRHLL